MKMNIEKQILDFLKSNSESSSNQTLENIEEKKSIATIKRILSKLVSENLIVTIGKGKSTRYKLSPSYNRHDALHHNKN